MENTANQVAQNMTPLALTSRYKLAKFLLLSLITCGIYGIYTIARMGQDLNLIASPHDGKRTMSFWLLMFVVGPITLGIGFLVWYHKFSARIGAELARRGQESNFGASTFWLWNVLGTLILVGPFVYINKLCAAMNCLVDDYNKSAK